MTRNKHTDRHNSYKNAILLLVLWTYQSTFNLGIFNEVSLFLLPYSLKVCSWVRGSQCRSWPNWWGIPYSYPKGSRHESCQTRFFSFICRYLYNLNKPFVVNTRKEWSKLNLCFSIYLEPCEQTHLRVYIVFTVRALSQIIAAGALWSERR